MLAITAAESKDPSRDLPKAIKQTFWRVLIVFMCVYLSSSPSKPKELSLITAFIGA